MTRVAAPGGVLTDLVLTALALPTFCSFSRRGEPNQDRGGRIKPTLERRTIRRKAHLRSPRDRSVKTAPSGRR